MNGCGPLTRLVAGSIVLAMLAGCSPSSSAQPSSVQPASPQPTAASSLPAASPLPGEYWDLVWFSDSSATVAELWAARIEDVTSVKVTVHDFWGPAIRGSASFIADLTEVEAVAEAIAGAEVIGLYANPALTVAGDALADACRSGDPTGDPPRVFTEADFDEYADLLRFIYRRILELRQGQPTVIRAVDLYVPVISGWRAAGIEQACTASWEAWTSAARRVASEYGVPMASMYDAFNGPDHDQDPVAKGYIGDDGEHCSDAGRAVQVDVLDALGYDAIVR